MDKIVYAILIDAAAQAIKVVKLGEDHLHSAYKLIGCDLIEAATRLPNGDVVYVDEEALVKVNPPKGSFIFQGRVFKGNGLIVNESGEDWTAPHSPVIQLFHDIVLPNSKPVPAFTPADILAAIVGGQFKVMTSYDYDGFDGAQPGSLICYDFGQDHWTVIVSPGESHEEAISVHAYLFPSVDSDGPQDEVTYELTSTGWSEI